MLSELRISVAAYSGVGCRCSSDPALLWLWYRLAAAALVPPLVQELPYAEGATLKRKRKKKKKVLVCLFYKKENRLKKMKLLIKIPYHAQSK